MMRTTPAFAVRVVSYNVLSNHLASPSHFTTVDPSHLEASNRLPKIFTKLEEEISNNTKEDIVFCLQEVSNDWAGEFHTWFANRGYHLVTGLYGKKFNGYMGIALAYPTAAFETIDVDISRLADKRVGGWPRRPDPPGLATRLLTAFGGAVKYPFEAVGLLNVKKKIDPWEMSQNRFNILLTATLKDKVTGKSFCIGNYHMPCAFFAPKVMSIHAEMAARHIQDLASSRNAPFILAGDWNIIPDSPTYNLLTTGKLDSEDPTYPHSKNGMEWSPTAQAMKSAYAESKHGEPNFTNYAQTKEQEPFIEVLDYIFLSKEWRVMDVKPVVHRDVVNGPLPNKAEPSDHVMIAANLELW